MLHHVMNRGANKQAIVVDDRDRVGFFAGLTECAERFGVWTCGACLMDNHYHLLLLDEFGRLSRAMRHLNGVYTQAFNRRHGRDGPLFRGRYLSRLVERESYLLEVIRYIHANPVDAGLVEHAGDYPWSSHRAYISGEAAPWLHKDIVLEYIGDDPDQLRWFDRYVHERVAPEMKEVLEPARWSPILGSDSFVAAVRTRLRVDGTSEDPEVLDANHLGRHSPHEIIVVAQLVFELPREDLVQGCRGTLNIPRLVTLLMCRDRTAAKANDLARIFGVRRPTISVLAAKARRLVAEDVAAAEAWMALTTALAATIQRAT